MSKKVNLILFLGFVLLFSGTVQKVNGTWYISGWIGKYLAIGHIAIDPWEPKVNENATFEIYLQNWKDLSIKTIDVRIAVADAIYNETLAEDMYWEKPPNALAGAIYRLVKLTPHEEGFISLYIFADYQYSEGNQILEQQGTFELLNVAQVRRSTWSDLNAEKLNLVNKIDDLNSTMQNLNVSYLNLQASFLILEIFTLFLAFSTCALIATTVYFAKKKHYSRTNEGSKIKAVKETVH